MASEAERFLRKARESLASAEADVEAGRYNSAANRAYYAAFQAAIAALSGVGVQPSKLWEHRFVHSQLSGRLVRGRKVLPATAGGVLKELFDWRIVGDYRQGDVSARHAARCLRIAVEFIGQVEFVTGKTEIRDASTEYGAANMVTSVKAKTAAYVAELKTLVTKKFPGTDFEVIRLGPRDYQLVVWGDYEDAWDVTDTISARRSEIFDESGVWIVVLPLQRSDRLN